MSIYLFTLHFYYYGWCLVQKEVIFFQAISSPQVEQMTASHPLNEIVLPREKCFLPFAPPSKSKKALSLPAIHARSKRKGKVLGQTESFSIDIAHHWSSGINLILLFRFDKVRYLE